MTNNLPDLIELLRSKEALIAVGQRRIPLPPQGRLCYPKKFDFSRLNVAANSNEMEPDTPIIVEIKD